MIRYGLAHLYDRVVARMTAESVTVPQAFGWNAASEQLRSTARIVWTPGDASGGLGAIVAPRTTGELQRQLATLEELGTVEITAWDVAAQTDELAQYTAALTLFEQWFRAVWTVAHGTFRVISASWTGGPRVRRMGATIRVVVAVQTPLVDRAESIAAVEVGADLEVADLDVTEQIEVSPPSP